MNPMKDGMTTSEEASPTQDPAQEPREALDLATVRHQLQQAQGPQYWRSLEELAGSEGFQEMLHREFPRFAAEWPCQDNGNANPGVSRRGFLELAAASLALAGLTACTTQPQETIVPFVRQPENYIPGHPLYYATAMELAGTGLGLLAESHLGRPTKLEGNPEHPASLGATDALAQASVLSLYDPDRSQTQTYLGQIGAWEDLAAQIRTTLPALEALQGEGLRILTRTVSSPTLAAQLTALEERFPKARWHQYEPCGNHAARAAAAAAFGQPLATRYDFSRAEVVLALDADFLTAGPGAVRYAKEFSKRRRAGLAEDGPQGMNRLYVAESSPTNTGATADHRLALAPSELLRFTAALATELRVPGARPVGELTQPAQEWVTAVAADLSAHRGASVVIPGVYAAPQVHVLAQAINAALGNVGTTVIHAPANEARAEDQLGSIAQLVADMRAGKVDTLVILDGNPAYDAPADLDFAATMLAQVKTRIHLGLYRDETSEYCQWHIPAAHFLESWSDCRAFDGTASIVQPLIEPLHGGRTAHEVVALFSERADATAHELVQGYWQTQGLDEAGWRQALHDGVIAGSAAASVSATISQEAVAQACTEETQEAGRHGLELCLRPDPSVFDGRFANNAWLQELPKALSKLTWDNAFLISPATAQAHGLKTEDLIEVRLGERKVVGPVWIMPGQADGAITAHLGYGRTHAGRVGNGAGFDAYPLYTAKSGSASVAIATVEIAATGATYPLSSTQEHFAVELQSEEAHERHLVRHADYATYQHQPDFAQHMGHPAPGPEESMFPPWEYKGYAWGLAVDLNTCTGCNACVTACQSENNIPVVGKVQVANGREMHWLRIDRYYQGDLDQPDVHFQPVMCQQCEQAPCEVVCPVGATSHSSEGLNDMVYNRCVGTRYCSNNCPYKVRRFNFLSYTDHDSELLAMGRNPDVTVRSRGVMEKCTYCVQRINQARIEAKKQDRKIRDGEIQTACQQACPADALVFGDINDADSAVSQSKASPLNYALLGDLGTRPRTTYLAKVTNPNPALGHGQPAHEGDHG